MSAPVWDRRRARSRRVRVWRQYLQGRGPAVALEAELNARSPARSGPGALYDLDGRVAGLGTWAVLMKYAGPGVRVLARTRCRTPEGPVDVSTVWLGMDHGWGGGPPVLWESMTFGPEPWNGLQQRYSSRADAMHGHAQVVAALRAGRLP